MPDLIRVCVFGREVVPRLPEPVPEWEADGFDCRHYRDDRSLNGALVRDRPQVIATFGPICEFPNLSAAPEAVRHIWVHCGDETDPCQAGRTVLASYLKTVLDPPTALEPLVTVFTAAYKPGVKVGRPFGSLLEQSYRNWEWVVVDDSDDDGQTWREMAKLANRDSRVRLLRTERHSGRIGEVKRLACSMARGKYLVELDHDDEITQDGLRWIVEAFRQHPEAGFVYTDFAECFEDRRSFQYGPGWGHGYGSYRDETYRGRVYKAVNSPNVNPKTIRHIVAAPNHARVWERDLYDGIGGHNPALHVADDYELMVRTFLATRMVRVPRMCYLQYRNAEGNTHQSRNRDIHRLVRCFSTHYDRLIHERFVELGVDDFVWRPGRHTFWNLNSVPNPAVESHCTIVAEV